MAIYYKGNIAAQDFSEAAKWLESAAAQDSAIAQYFLSTMYRTGLVFEKDMSRAGVLAMQSARGGLMDGKIAVSEMDMEGVYINGAKEV